VFDDMCMMPSPALILFSQLGLLILFKRTLLSSDDFSFWFASPTVSLAVLHSSLIVQSRVVGFDWVANNFGVLCYMCDSWLLGLLQVEAGPL
jgi:hypothetical protein